MRTKQEIAELLADNSANPPMNDSIVKEALKQLKGIAPRMKGLTSDKDNFYRFSLPKDGGEVRVSVIVEQGPNEDAGSFNAPRITGKSAGLVNDENMYASIYALKPSNRTGSELYQMTVTIFK